jgi:4,5-DOPA dioxygenase extradiol
VTTPPTNASLPVLFVGHGSPMNAVDDNEWSRGFQRLAALLPVPKAILAVSAHWYVAGTFTTGNPHPETIHDFGGFPDALYQVQYPAPGDPALARRVVDLLASRGATVRTDWGLDHGTWTVLKYLRPKADVPVVQLSIDHRLPPDEHVEIGKALAPLRSEGVLVLASGNITHNLRHAFQNLRSGDRTTPDWASRFDADAARALEQYDTDFLARAVTSDIGRMSHPTPDHYYPLLYAAGAAHAGEAVKYPVDGFDMGSLSMRSVLIG